MNLMKLFSFIKGIYTDDSAQGMAEYALLLFLIAVACIGVMSTVGKNFSSKLAEVGSKVLSAK
jgi:Flp pilus assembly pilin Flp